MWGRAAEWRNTTPSGIEHDEKFEVRGRLRSLVGVLTRFLVNASTLLFVLFDHAPRVLVFPPPCEFRMPEMIDLRFILHLSID
jgi:hypothetical protein